MSRLVKAQLLLKRGHPEAAENVMENALDSPDPRDALVLARIRGLRYGPESAIEVLEKARERHPGNSPLHLEYGIAVWDASRFDNARAAFEQVLAMQPLNDVALSYHALALLQADEGEAARAIFRKHGFSDNRMFRVRLTHWMETQWLEQNRYFFQREAVIDPAPPRATMKQAEKAFYQKEFAKVLAIVEPLYAHKPGDDGLRFACAVSAEMLHDYSRAMRHLNTPAPVNEEQWPDALRAVRGRCRLRLRDFEGAASDLGKVLILGPEDFGLNYYLGVLCLAHGEQARSREFFRRAHTDYMVDTLEFQFWQIETALFQEPDRSET